MTVYNYIGYKHDESRAEYKRKRKLADAVYAKCNKNGYEYHPICDGSGLMIHVALDKRQNIDYVVLAESKDILPKVKEEFKFMSTEEFLK